MFEHLRINRQLKKCAQELERRKSAGERPTGEILPEPVLNCHALGKIEGTPLLSWMYFNPFGPSLCTLFFVPVPGSQDSILAFNSLNPLQKDWVAYLLVPGALSPKAIEASVGALFAANGHHTAPLLSSLPTSVFHADNWPLPVKKPAFSGSLVRSLFRIVTTQLPNLDFETTNSFLRHYKNDPWERTAAGVQEELLKFVIRTDQPKTKFDDALFEEWFDLVSDPEHASSEQSNFQAAWQGAIANAQRKHM